MSRPIQSPSTPHFRTVQLTRLTVRASLYCRPSALREKREKSQVIFIMDLYKIKNVEGCKYVFICRTTMILFVGRNQRSVAPPEPFYINVISSLVALLFLSIE